MCKYYYFFCEIFIYLEIANKKKGMKILKFILITILFPLTSLQFGIFIGGNNQNATTNGTTNQIIEKDDQNSCKCNLKYKICDLHCCCDQDCSEPILKNWKDNNLCIPIEIIDPIDRFKCAGYDLYLNRMINKNYSVESKILIL